MRCFMILALVLACLTHCLAQNAVAAKAPRKSDVSQTKLCELVLQKLELSQRINDKKTLIPIDNIIDLLEIIKKSTPKESGQAPEKSGLNKDLEKDSESADNATRRFRGRFHWHPKHSHRITHHVLETIPEVIRVIKSQPEYDDPPDEERAYLESSYYYPTERRLDVDPPPFVPVTRSSIQQDDFQVDEEPRKAESEAKGTSVRQSVGTKNRLSDASENAKVTRPPRQQGSNDTLDMLKHLMGNSDNAKVKALLKTLMANQKAGSVGEKKEKTRPEVIKTIRMVDGLRKPNSKDSKVKTEPAQAASSDKKSSSRRNKPNTKGKDIPDETSNRLEINDDWEWDSEPLTNYVPRHVHSKVHRADENVNKNVNVNTNTDTRIPRVGSRRSSGTRTHRHQDRNNVDRNTNANTNTNTDTNEIPSSGPAVDRFISMRRSLDHFLDDDHNSNVNTNINTNSNSNRPVVPRNKHRGRELRGLV